MLHLGALLEKNAPKCCGNIDIFNQASIKINPKSPLVPTNFSF